VASADGGGPRRGRGNHELRPVTLERGAVAYAEGSCLVSFGATRVLCAASVETGVPAWRRGSGEGWVTAEYAMLPRATHTRTSRERGPGGMGGRTQEIQRLIGRSVRAMLDSFAFGEYTIRVDCDVLQADGGTRTAAITGACVAVTDALDWLVQQGHVGATPVRRRVAAVSVGVIDGEPRVDLEYAEDVRADVDMNVVVATEIDASRPGGGSRGGGGPRFVEVQGTGEHGTFDRAELDTLIALAVAAIEQLDGMQRAVLAAPTSVVAAATSRGGGGEASP
jgi:ribonuclease PH